MSSISQSRITTAKIDLLAFIFGAAAIALRGVVLFGHRTDSDEPQHLHVAWEWSQGRIPYRDFYDNHMPLFHMLTAPWIDAVGETPRILLYGRLLMIPLAICVLALSWMLAARLYDRATANWTLLAVTVMPPLALKTTEFRNDNLWLLLLLLVLLALIRERWIIAGLLLGLALTASIKTVVFALAIAVAIVVTRGRSAIRPLTLVVLGSLAAPLAVLAFFASHGAMDDLIRWGVLVNGTVPVAPLRRAIGILSGSTITILAIVMALRSARDTRCLAALMAALHIAFTVAISPLVGPRDFLPVYPLMLMFLMAHISEPVRRFVIASLIVITIAEADLWEPRYRYHQNVIEAALRLTTPSDLVFDHKGEMVFRRRAVFIELESVGRKMLFNRVLPDTIADEIRQRRAYVAVEDSARIPPASRRFLNRYFVDHGDVRIAGQRIRANGRFEIAIAGPYTIVDRSGAVRVASKWYEPGSYIGPPFHFALWSRAVERRAR
jgi:Dolichyl-phosphate-mannose-protein mannosyltransferase